MNNSPFGKTMENAWKRVNIKIVRSEERKKVRRLIASPLFADSLLQEIETDDVYKDMGSKKELYDACDYPKDHPLHSSANNKVLGKMKDEMKGVLITENICLRPKIYSVLG